MLEWMVATGVFALLLGLLPWALRRTRASVRKSGGGIFVGIGLGFATLFDPKIAAAMEIVEQKQEEAEDEDSGDQP